MEDKQLIDKLVGDRDMNASKWADEFMRIVIGGKIEIDQGLMIGWFANIAMCGYDTCAANKNTEIKKLREALEKIKEEGILVECCWLQDMCEKALKETKE